MTTTEPALRRLLDEASIRDAIARFADSATVDDRAAFRSTWAENGRWRIGDRVDVSSADEIVSTLAHLREGRDFFVQFAACGPISIDGDTATTRCLVHEAARGPGPAYYRNHCLTQDRLQRTDEGWVFVDRSFHYLWLDTSPFDGDAFPVPHLDGTAPTT